MEHEVLFDEQENGHERERASDSNSVICSALLAMTLVLSWCDSKSIDSPALPRKSWPGDLHSLSLDVLDIAVLQKNFEDACLFIKKKYGITVQVADASDTLYIMERMKIDKYEAHLIPIVRIDRSRWVKLNDIMNILEMSLSVYDAEFIQVIKTVHISDGIENADAYSMSDGTDGREWRGNNGIVIPSNDKHSLKDIKEAIDHEITHILRNNRHEPWPFVSPNLGYKWQWQPESPVWFAQNYGTSSSGEDTATMGAMLMSLFWGTEPNYNLINRAKTDPILSQKIMFMTGSYFDATKWEFTRDFTLKEFQEYFQLPDLKELPFYARMRKKGRFDYAFWNMYITPNPILADKKLVTWSTYDVKAFKTWDDDR